MKTQFLSVLALLLLVGCQQQWVYDAERRQQISARDLPDAIYDVPPKVIYRIDDHRFLTLENYNKCYGDTWYNNTKQGVRTKIGATWVTGFRGKLIIDDPTEMNIAIPRVSTNLCGDRGCANYVAYSTDGGRTFQWVRYDGNNITSDSVRASERYTFSVTQDSMYITIKIGQMGHTLTNQYPLGPGYVYGRNGKLPEGVRVKYDVTLPDGLRTPSGDDHYVCTRANDKEPEPK